MLLCLWDSPGKNTGLGSRSFLQRISPTQGLNSGFLCCRQILLPSEPPGKPCCLPGAAAAAKSLQLCPTLCDPIDSSPPDSAVPGILQARTLEWVAISNSKLVNGNFLIQNPSGHCWVVFCHSPSLHCIRGYCTDDLSTSGLYLLTEH